VQSAAAATAAGPAVASSTVPTVADDDFLASLFSSDGGIGVIDAIAPTAIATTGSRTTSAASASRLNADLNINTEDIILDVEFENMLAEVNGTAHEVSGTAHEVNGTAHEVSGTAHKVSGTGHEVSGTAHEVSGTAHEVSGTAHEEPRNNVLVLANAMPSSGAEVAASPDDFMTAMFEDMLVNASAQPAATATSAAAAATTSPDSDEALPLQTTGSSLGAAAASPNDFLSGMFEEMLCTATPASTATGVSDDNSFAPTPNPVTGGAATTATVETATTTATVATVATLTVATSAPDDFLAGMFEEILDNAKSASVATVVNRSATVLRTPVTDTAAATQVPAPDDFLSGMFEEILDKTTSVPATNDGTAMLPTPTPDTPAAPDDFLSGMFEEMLNNATPASTSIDVGGGTTMSPTPTTDAAPDPDDFLSDMFEEILEIAAPASLATNVGVNGAQADSDCGSDSSSDEDMPSLTRTAVHVAGNAVPYTSAYPENVSSSGIATQEGKLGSGCTPAPMLLPPPPSPQKSAAHAPRPDAFLSVHPDDDEGDTIERTDGGGEMGRNDDDSGGEMGRTDDGCGGEMGRTDDGCGGEMGRTDDGCGGEMGRTDDGCGGEMGRTDDDGARRHKDRDGLDKDPTLEFKVDSSDGVAYPLDSFLEVYSGSIEHPPAQWLEAAPAGYGWVCLDCTCTVLGFRH
jgi:hypothetical protein